MVPPTPSAGHRAAPTDAGIGEGAERVDAAEPVEAASPTARKKTGRAAGVNVLITGGEFLSVLATVRALRAVGHVPWVAVHGPGAYAARSRATAGSFRVPSAGKDPRGFVRAVAWATEHVGAAVVIPGTEIAAFALADHADAFPRGVALGIGPAASLRAVTDKTTLERTARLAGLGVPPTVVVQRGALPAALPFDFPVVVKPPRSEQRDERGVTRHYGARVARSLADVEAALDALPEGCALVQPFLRGRLVSLAGVFWDGELVGAVQAVADRLWPVPCGSISAGRTVALEPRLANAVADLLRPTGWRGLFQLDAFEEDGEYVVIDLNPRIYVSLAHATRAGVNLPAIWVDLLLGRQPDVPATYREGVRYRHDEGDVRALARMFLEGRRRDALVGMLPRPNTAYTVFAANDPRPLMTTVDRTIRYVQKSIRRRSYRRPASAQE